VLMMPDQPGAEAFSRGGAAAKATWWRRRWPRYCAVKVFAFRARHPGILARQEMLVRSLEG
jgi:hypothetical protein